VLLQSEEAPIDDLIELVRQIVAFHMKVWNTENIVLNYMEIDVFDEGY
jgi:hypothetical protein